MPRNLTGGSGHKSQRNSESNKVRNNRTLIDELLFDYADKKKAVEDVFIGRVLRRMGQGRMEVFYSETIPDDDEGTKKMENTVIAPIRGGMRGKGKKGVWVDPGSIVMVIETGLAGAMSHEIVAVFTDEQVTKLRRLRPDLNPKLFVKGETEGGEDEGGIIFEKGEDSDGSVDVDDI